MKRVQTSKGSYLYLVFESFVYWFRPSPIAAWVQSSLEGKQSCRVGKDGATKEAGRMCTRGFRRIPSPVSPPLRGYEVMCFFLPIQFKSIFLFPFPSTIQVVFSSWTLSWLTSWRFFPLNKHVKKINIDFFSLHPLVHCELITQSSFRFSTSASAKSLAV